MFFDEIERFGDKTALLDESGRIVSYRELCRLADGFAGQLGADRKLALVEVKNSLESIVALVACFRSDTPFILQDGRSPHDLTATFLPEVIIRPGGELEWTRMRGPMPPHPHLSVLLSTSGSTGSAKLVRLSRSAIAANAASIATYLGIGPDARAITLLPISYSYGLSVVTSHLLAGGSLVISDRPVIDPDFWNLIDSREVTSLAGVPHTYQSLEASRFRERSHPSLRCLTQAGGRLSPDLVRSFAVWARSRGIAFYPMYGQTEAAPRMAYLPPDRAVDHPDCIGRAIPGGRLRVVDACGSRVPPGAIGQLVYDGPNVMMGYAMTPADLARGHDLTELYTGDLAQEVEPDLFRIVGRSSRFSKIAGLRIGLDDVERLLERHGFAAAVAGDDDLIAINVEGDAGVVPAVEALLCRTTAIPAQSRIVFSTPDLPRLATGKLDYPGVMRAGLEHRRQRLCERRCDGQERSLAKVFAQAFAGREPDRRSSFVSLGGDSLAFVELSLAIEHELGHLPRAWERMSIDQLDGLVAEAQGRSTGAIPPVRTEIALRAIAASMIVAHHILPLDLGGGTDVLLLLLGFNLNRSQAGQLASPQRWAILFPVIMRVLVPYYALMCAYDLLWHPSYEMWTSFLLLLNYYPLRGNEGIYWFVSAYLQILFVLISLSSLACVSRFMTERPERFAVLFLAASIAVKIVMFKAFPSAGAWERPDQLLYIVAAGWCLHVARRATVRLLAVGACAGFAVLGWGDLAASWWSRIPGHWHGVCLFAGAAMLAYVPALNVPKPVRVGVTNVALASLTIYLVQPPLVSMTLRWFASPRVDNPLCYVAITSILAVGVLLYRLAGHARPYSRRVKAEALSLLQRGRMGFVQR